MTSQAHPDWLPADIKGVSTAWLTDPTRSTLRGMRLRCAFDRAAPVPAIIDRSCSGRIRTSLIEIKFPHSVP